MIVAPLLAALAAAPSFAGVTLGESATALLAQMGDPTLVRTGAEGVSYIYVTDRSAGGYVTIYLRENDVVEVHATTNAARSAASYAALGVALGSPASALAALPAAGERGLRAGADGLLYGFDAKDGIVHRIVAALPPAEQAALKASAAPALHGGTSFDDALVVGAANEMTGVAAEYAYFDLNTCPGGGSWKTRSQSLVDHGGKPYDVLAEVCSTGGAERSFYFDISRYFGKL